MSSLPNFAVIVAIGAVALVLTLGLINMLRDGASSRSQSLMRWRVGLQFAAILIIVAVLLLRSHSSIFQ